MHTFGSFYKFRCGRQHVNGNKSDSTLNLLNSDASFRSNFVAKPKDNGSIDLVFESFSKALEVKKYLNKKIDELNSGHVVPIDMSRWNIAAIPFAISKEEAIYNQ